MARPRGRCLHRREMLLWSCCNYARARARYECGLAQHGKADKLAALPHRDTLVFVHPCLHRSCAHQGEREAVLVAQKAPCGYAFKTALSQTLELWQLHRAAKALMHQ